MQQETKTGDSTSTCPLVVNKMSNNKFIRYLTHQNSKLHGKQGKNPVLTVLSGSQQAFQFTQFAPVSEAVMVKINVLVM